MKKILALLMALIMLFSLVGCKRGDDIEEITKSGKIVIGVTDYKPVSYKADGEWTGFEVELARLFAKELGVEAEFREIEWAKRYDELINYNIDAVFNAMTILEHSQNHITVSDAYLENSMILVVREEDKEKFADGYLLKKYKFVIEEYSSADERIDIEGYTDHYTVKTQKQALDDVASGKADATLIDSIYANVFVGEGKDYPTLIKSLVYSDENCAAGFRKDSKLVERFNEFLKDIAENELIELANKYELTLY